MQDQTKKLQDFVDWFHKHIKGYEKGEGQLFFNKLLQAFGNAGVLEVGASLEERVRKRKGTIGFADFVWKPRVIIELKERGTPLQKCYSQAFEYWLTLVPNRPQYMILCNFDEFWIYDLNIQLGDPVHVLKTSDLAKDWGALSFLKPKIEKPIFNNNNVEVTEAAAKIVGSLYFSLSSRGVDSIKAQRFVLQIVVALFAEDTGLIPKYTLHKILKEAVRDSVIQKELTDLFLAMATEQVGKKPKKYKDIQLFNGEIFHDVEAIELSFKELDLLYEASKQDWSKVRPSIFGAIFESSMDPKERHGHGIHYTSELDIQKIVNPTILRPFREKIDSAKSKKDLSIILKDVRDFKVLDPACGSGNFLYVAFRELRRLEVEILNLIAEKEKSTQLKMALVSPKNFYGIDTNRFGLELAKVALSIGRKLSADEFGVHDNILPFDNLDENFLNKDALFVAWPNVEAIIGNPPFQSKNKIKKEMGLAYVNQLRLKYPKIPGRADYCVYWIRKAHDSISENGHVGLVGTNTIRQNYSREGGLDYVVKHGGTITEAVASQVWSGDAVVHVSIVNWIKGLCDGPKKLFKQIGDSLDSPWEVSELERIPASLTKEVDLTGARVLKTNKNSYVCYQGQTHGHEGFLLSKDDALAWIAEDPKNKEVLFPFITYDELLANSEIKIKRYVIDFHPKSLVLSQSYKKPFSAVLSMVLPDRKIAATEEEEINKKALDEDKDAKVNHHHKNFLNRWWMLSYPREELIEKIKGMKRYIICGRVTKRPIFEFVDSLIHPNDALMVFLFEDIYSFGILQSSLHWKWFFEKGSSMKADPRYTSNSVFDTFPWPQNPSPTAIRDVANAAENLRIGRNKLKMDSGQGLRALYKSLELPGKNPLRDLQEALDDAVRKAYGFNEAPERDLEKLLELNFLLSEIEAKKGKVQSPGLPPCVEFGEYFEPKEYIQET